MSSSEVSLLQMPEDPMEHILEYLDFPSIVTLRKVCHDLRNFIDDTKPASRLTEIKVRMHAESISFELCFPQPPCISIDYEENGEGCLVKCKKERKVKGTTVKDEDFATAFCKDFDIILRHQMTVLEQCSIIMSASDSTFKEKALKNVNKSLKSMNHLLQVKSLRIRVNNHNEILSVLPYFDSKSLKKIHIYVPSRRGSMFNLDEIGKLEQWKKADELLLHAVQSTNLSRNLRHFSKIIIGFENVSIEQLNALKELFLYSSTLKSMEMCYCRELSQHVLGQTLIESFGQHFLDINHESNWFFRIPDTNQFLRIYCKCIKLSIYFDRIEQSDVPLNAIILN